MGAAPKLRVMHTLPSRRILIGTCSLGVLTAFDLPAQVAPPAEWLPRLDPELVRQTVGFSHSDVRRVRELVELHPTLANAAIDGGFGDWEDALGAASHTGRREIAELLLDHGARVSIFSAAMMGQLDVVKAFVTARPGVQRTLGPHGIPLMAHAKAGGPGAEPVVKYLESVGDADTRTATQPLENSDRDSVAGRYVFGAGPRDYFDVDVKSDRLGIERPGAMRRLMSHLGNLVFFPSGAPTVKIAFARENGKVVRLSVADPVVYLTAQRTS